jgi:hypothetical protein
MHSLNKGGEFSHTKSVLITLLFSKRGGEGEKFAAEVEKGVYEADLVSFVPQFILCISHIFLNKIRLDRSSGKGGK